MCKVVETVELKVTAEVLTTSSLGSVGVHVTVPDRPTALIAPLEQVEATLSCTWVELTCLAPTEPLMILRAPTALDLSLKLPTLLFWICAFPTLFGGSWVAA